MNQFDPNKFDPNKGIHKANLNHQGGNKQEAAQESAQEAAPTGDPYADAKMNPDELMSLLSAQAKYNMHNTQIENTPILRSMQAFTEAVSPEAHARVSDQVKDTFLKEFGKLPNADVLQNAIDDFFIGTPVVEA